MISLIWESKYDINELIYRKKQNFRHGEQAIICERQRDGLESLRLVDANHYK